MPVKVSASCSIPSNPLRILTPYIALPCMVPRADAWYGQMRAIRGSNASPHTKVVVSEAGPVLVTSVLPCAASRRRGTFASVRISIRYIDGVTSARSTLAEFGESLVPHVAGNVFCHATCPSLNNTFPP